MKTLLQKAFEEAAKLPDEEQEQFAEWVLNELASEKKWLKAFEGSHDKLSDLADEALSEYRSGKTQELDPDNL